MLDSNPEKLEDNYISIKINDKSYYQCKFCDFISDRKYILKNHLEKKNKCYITDSIECNYCKKKFKNKTILKNHLEKQKKCYMTQEIVISETINKKKEKNIYDIFSNLLLEREKKKNETNNHLEYNILYNSLTIYKIDGSNIKDKLFLFMSIINYEQLIDFFIIINLEYNYLIQYMIEYYNYLKTFEDEFINGKNRNEYLEKIKKYIKIYFNIDLEEDKGG